MAAFGCEVGGMRNSDLHRVRQRAAIGLRLAGGRAILQGMLGPKPRPNLAPRDSGDGTLGRRSLAQRSPRKACGGLAALVGLVERHHWG